MKNKTDACTLTIHSKACRYMNISGRKKLEKWQSFRRCFKFWEKPDKTGVLEVMRIQNGPSFQGQNNPEYFFLMATRGDTFGYIKIM